MASFDILPVWSACEDDAVVDVHAQGRAGPFPDLMEQRRSVNDGEDGGDRGALWRANVGIQWADRVPLNLRRTLLSESARPGFGTIHTVASFRELGCWPARVHV
jgi:hypothetical protein